MVSTLDITASLPVDTVTVVNAASVSVFALQLQNAYRSHVDNTTYNGYGPDQHQTSHIAVPAAGIGIGTASSNAATDLQTFLQEITTQVANIVGGSPASWAAVSPPTSLTLINNAITGHTIIAASAASATTATTAGSFTAPQPYTSTISDYRVTPGAAGQLTIAAGGAYEDSNGNVVGPLGSQTANLPTQPTGTNTQYVGISLTPGTGAPTVTAGTLNAAESALIFPTGYRASASVLLRGATTNPGYVIAAGDIKNFVGGSGSGSTGSGTGLSTADPVVTVGAISDDANETDIVALLNGTASGTVNGQDRALIAGGKGMRANANAGSVADTWQLYVQADTASRFSSNGATTVTLSAGATVGVNGPLSPLTLGTNGVLKTNTAPITWTMNGAAGVRFLIADLSGGAGFTAFNGGTPPTSNTTGANQVCLGLCYWDGASLQPFGENLQYVDTSPIANLPSSSVTLTSKSYVSTTTSDAIASTGGNFVIQANFPVHSFYLPFDARVIVHQRARVDMKLTASTDLAECLVIFDNGLAGQVGCAYMGILPPNTATYPYYKQDTLVSFDDVVLTAGTHTVGQYWNATAGAVGTYYGTIFGYGGRKILLEFFRKS